MKDFEFPNADTPIKRHKNVAVVGGGNVAMDSVRTALRLGADNAYIVYRRGMEELPAQTTPDMQFNRKGYIVVESEKTGRTTKKGVFAGGDIVTGAATVILAAGAGRSAGMAIDKFLKDGEWWDPNAPKPAEAAPAAK